jgi:hypothetical protein
MGALRIELVNLGVNSGSTGFSIFLDCWKASIYLRGDSQFALLNGNEISQMIGTVGSLDELTAPFVLGGLVMDGKPVNMNFTLNFNQLGGIGLGRFVGCVWKEYYDPSLPDPLK